MIRLVSATLATTALLMLLPPALEAAAGTLMLIEESRDGRPSSTPPVHLGDGRLRVDIVVGGTVTQRVVYAEVRC